MSTPSLNNFINHINSQHLPAILKIQNVLLMELQKFAHDQGFIQIMPLLMSPITDPLNHDVYPAELQYEERKLKLTASMIFHKQLALIPENINKIYIMAPNIRLELAKKKSSSNHLLEFSQFDIEIKNANMDEIMAFIEKLYVHIFAVIEKECAAELTLLGRKLPKMKGAFPRYSTEGMPLTEVDAFCNKLSAESPVPCFVTNFKREFYDKEDPAKKGVYRNFDLVYPENYGEALSGAEREYEYNQIIRRMQELNTNLTAYENYLEMSKHKLIPRTAGCGIGIQRLLKFICGKPQIKDVCLFDRSILSEFTF